MNYLPEKSNWFNPKIEYLFNSLIYEYDIKNAGFSIIKEFNLLPSDEIIKLSSMEKTIQTIEIGKIMGRNQLFSRQLLDHFSMIRKFFIDSNYITDNDIIAVKKDAIFSTKECSELKFGLVEFRIKNKYSSFIRFPCNNNLEIYYNDGYKLEVKGITESNLNKHRLYMLTFIQKMIKMIESKNSTVKNYFRNFLMDYKWFNLETDFYLKFNNLSDSIDPLFNYQQVLLPFAQIIIKERI